MGTHLWGVRVSQDKGITWKATNKGLEEINHIVEGIGVSRLFNVVFSPNFAADQTLFAGTWYRFLKSTDSGQHWQAINPLKGTQDHMGYTIAVSPNYTLDRTIYLGTRKGHILQSSNGGKDFAVVSTLDGPILDIAISPDFSADRTVFVGIPNQVYRSNNGGVDWKKVSQDIHLVETLNEIHEQVIRLAISPNYRDDKTAFVATAEGIFRTRTGGESWRKLLGLPVSDGFVEGLAISPNYTVDATLIVSIKGEGLFKSINGGETFEAIGTDLLSQNYQPANMYGFDFVAFSPPLQFSPTYADDRTIYAFAETNIFVSENAGETWEKVNIPMPDYNLMTQAYLSYLRFRFSPKKVFLLAMVMSLCGYFVLGRLTAIAKNTILTKSYVRFGGAFAIFISAFLILLR